MNTGLTGSGIDTVAASSVNREQGVSPDERAFTIGELSREFGVTLRTLRFYENKGLIAPHRRGATRLYSGADRDRIGQILAGKRLGFTLAEIRRMVDENRTASNGDLRPSREKCLEQIALLEGQKREIEAALEALKAIHDKFSADMPELGATR